MTIWAPVGSQSETWTDEGRTSRVFDPYVFDRSPIFDTGASLAGVWDANASPSEIWTPE